MKFQNSFCRQLPPEINIGEAGSVELAGNKLTVARREEIDDRPDVNIQSVPRSRQRGTAFIELLATERESLKGRLAGSSRDDQVRHAVELVRQESSCVMPDGNQPRGEGTKAA